MARTGKGGERNFERFAHVEDEDALASIETSLERRRFDCADIRHHATRARAALLFDVVRNSSTFENTGSSVHETENPNVSV